MTTDRRTKADAAAAASALLTSLNVSLADATIADAEATARSIVSQAEEDARLIVSRAQDQARVIVSRAHERSRSLTHRSQERTQVIVGTARRRMAEWLHLGTPVFSPNDLHRLPTASQERVRTLLSEVIQQLTDVMEAHEMADSARGADADDGAFFAVVDVTEPPEGGLPPRPEPPQRSRRRPRR